MMADFDLMELAPEQQEDLAYLHQQLFSTATEVVSTGAGEAATMVVTETTPANVNMLHEVSGFTGNYGNGNAAGTEPKEAEKAEEYRGEGEALIGRSIVKKFKRTKYAGKIIGYDPECHWYKVKYEDEDEEELEYKELEPLLVEAGEAEAVKAANVKKRTAADAETAKRVLATHFVNDASPAKKPRGRPAGEKKTPEKPKAEKKARDPKSLRASRKAAAPKTSESTDKDASESLQSSEKKAPTPASGEKRGRGRPRKDAAATPAKATPKAKAGTGGDSSSEASKPATRKATSAGDKGESTRGRSPRGRSAGVGLIFQVDENQLIGAKIKKKFNDKFYEGEVVNYDSKMCYYKAKYEDGDHEEYTLKELRTLLIEDQPLPKTRGRARSSPAKSLAESPQKKQKVSTPKKSPANAQESARVGTQPRKRGRPAKAKRVEAEASDAGEASDADSDEQEDSGLVEDKGHTLIEPRRPSAALAAIRYATASNAENLECYGWGEVVQCYRTRCLELAATKLKPTTSPIVHLSASHHHLAALTAAGQVLVWRNQHGNIRTRCNGWEYISDLENKGIVLIDIAGPDIDRRSAGYGPQQEDQVPDPFFLDAVSCNGEDYLLQGSLPQEHVRTQRLRDNPKIKGLRSTLSQINLTSLKDLGLVVQTSVGTVESHDETPFVGYITDANQVYIRSATKEFMDEVNLVTGYTGQPLKIQCGGVYHAVLLTDDGRAWTWGHGYSPLPSSQASSSKGKNQSPYSTCHLALGTLVGRKVVDVGCYGEDFVALTSDGFVHHWTHGVANPAADIYNTPSTPAASQGPSIAPGDKIKRVSIGVGVCAGVTEQGKVHTWRALWRGALTGWQRPGTPLGREHSGMQTVVPSLGSKFAIQVICVAGSLIVVAEKKAKGRPKTKE